MKKITIKKMFAGLCLVLLAPLSALANVEINEKNFPDKNFRIWLRLQDYGQDGVITDDEFASVWDMVIGADSYINDEDKYIVWKEYSISQH